MGFLTTDAYAKVMNLTSGTVQTLCREGRIPCVKIGGQWRIPEPTDEAKLPEPEQEPKQDREFVAKALAETVYNYALAGIPVTVSFGGATNG